MKIRTRRGQGLIEAASGLVVLVIIGLVSIDFSIMVASCQANENLAENAARAAGRQPNILTASQAAQSVIDNFQPSPPINSVSLENFAYNLTNGQVSLSTKMDVKLTIPFGSINTLSFEANSVAPIVATPASM